MRHFPLTTLLVNVIVTASAQSPYIEAVDEYVPAPGQFVNTLPAYTPGDDAAAMAAHCTEALAHNAGGMVTLGAWGGYITFHFDHPVVNVAGEHDLCILGNATGGGSEAGIVCVSRDDNGNGLPDDVWYELSGSADADSLGVRYGYTLTYTQVDALHDVTWLDNEGREGAVVRNAYHQQEYFPLWLDSPLTFAGTCLPTNAHDQSQQGSYWVLDAFAYGYVDNVPNSDIAANSFDLEWAVEPLTRMPVHLPYVDYVRVYTALNQSAGWLGETSTEVTNAYDLHPQATAAIHTLRADHASPQRHSYDLMGRPCTGQYMISIDR